MPRIKVVSEGGTHYTIRSSTKKRVMEDAIDVFLKLEGDIETFPFKPVQMGEEWVIHFELARKIESISQ